MANPIAVPGTVVPIGALVTPGGGTGLQGLQGPQGPAGGSGGTTYTASQSVLLTGTNFTLANDAATPANGQCYGYSGGSRGWFTPPGANYTGTNSVLLTGTNFTLYNDASPPALGQFYGYRNGARQWCQPNFFNVLDYGADRSGAADSTNAITAAIAAMPSGGTLYFPSGTYTVSSVITINKHGRFFGDGKGNTSFNTNSATSDVFNITVSSVTMEDFSIYAAVTRTGGYYINAAGGLSYINIRNFFFNAHFYGIAASWSDGEIAHGDMYNVVANGIGIVMNDPTSNGPYDLNINNVIMDTAGATANTVGIAVYSCGGGSIFECDIIHHQYGMTINPSAINIAALYVTNTFLDTCGTSAVYMVPSGNTTVWLCKFTDCEFSGTSTSSYVVLLSTSGNGLIDTTDFTGCDIIGSGTQGGVLVNSSRVTCVNFNGCFITDNATHGMVFNTSVSNFSVTNCRIGNSFVYPGNHGYGLFFAGSNSGAIIMGNQLSGNTSGEQGGVALVAPFVNTNNI